MGSALRDLRRQLSRRLQFAAASIAPRLPEGLVCAAERLFRQSGPHLPVLGRLVEENLRSAGLYTPAVLRDYFGQVGFHLGSALRIFQNVGNPKASVRLAEQAFSLDVSTQILPRLLRDAGGLVIAAPHVCNYLLTLVRINQLVPVVDYQRWSGDERSRGIKDRWAQGAGLEVIREPPSATDPTSRAMALVETVRNGRALVLTPDLAQKSEKGVPVNFLGRRVFLPSGPASIAMLAGVPFVPMFGRMVEGRHQIYAVDPIEMPAVKRSEGGRPAALRRVMQVWADHCEAWLRTDPQLWFFWGDKAWTRVFHGDSRYGERLQDPAAPVSSPRARLFAEPEAQARGLSGECIEAYPAPAPSDPAPSDTEEPA